MCMFLNYIAKTEKLQIKYSHIRIVKLKMIKGVFNIVNLSKLILNLFLNEYYLNLNF